MSSWLPFGFMQVHDKEEAASNLLEQEQHLPLLTLCSHSFQDLLWLLEHIGLVARKSILDTEVDGSNPSISMFFSLSKTLYPHCFSRLSCEMSTRWGQPREGCSVL